MGGRRGRSTLNLCSVYMMHEEASDLTLANGMAGRELGDGGIAAAFLSLDARASLSYLLRFASSTSLRLSSAFKMSSGQAK